MGDDEDSAVYESVSDRRWAPPARSKTTTLPYFCHRGSKTTTGCARGTYNLHVRNNRLFCQTEFWPGVIVESSEAPRCGWFKQKAHLSFRGVPLQACLAVRSQSENTFENHYNVLVGSIGFPSLEARSESLTLNAYCPDLSTSRGSRNCDKSVQPAGPEPLSVRGTDS